MKTTKKHLNSPDINGKFNYIYKITNKINGKIYIGVHRTNNINDGYMGSGKYLKYSIQKHGIENFEKEILQYFKIYKDALQAERNIVTENFINSDSNYNIREGGYGNCGWSDEFIKKMSIKAKMRYENSEFKEKMAKSCWNNKERNEKIGKNVSKWIKENPISHQERMLKINKNPEKIARMAETHRGMKRSEDAKVNIAGGISNYYKTDKDGGAKRSGKGLIYTHNIITKEIKRQSANIVIPEGWARGNGRTHTRFKKGINLGSYFAHNIKTLQIKRFQKDEILPNGWIKGRPKKEGRDGRRKELQSI